MPENKSAITRFLILDECLRNQYAKFTLSSLLEKLNEKLIEKDIRPIGRTQFHKDLNYIEYDLGAPIIRTQDGQSKRISYEDTAFSIRNQTLNKSEIKTIRDSLATLLQFKGLHQLAELEELLPKLDKEFDLDAATENVIAFEENPFLKGLEHLNPLIEYIKHKTQLNVTYQNFKSPDAVNFDFSPYFLKRYNQRWFLFGQVKDLNQITNLALDRIETIEKSSSNYTLNTTYNWDEYFDDMIGVSRSPESEITKIILKFKPAQTPYVKTKPLHGSQKPVNEDETGYTLSIEVIPNYELESMILSFGNQCEVLAPEDLKESISKRGHKFNDDEI
ncbi:helix-turn-helix transcriptional regulator [Roseivirga echinicomitans]